MDFTKLLHLAVDHDASDIHMQARLKPILRIGGVLKTVDTTVLTDEQLQDFMKSISPPRFHANFEDRLTSGLDFSYDLQGVSRFRCSCYRQLGEAGITMRIIKNRIRNVAELHLPPVINDIALSGRGLTLVTGTTGSGKSTTLAAMLDLINTTRANKIITIEDPVEYMQVSKQSFIAQLEVGTDTPSFDQALRQAMRQDPDVILVGELRDMDTLRIALRAADTGHQVFSTVHSANAPQTIERIIAMFPPNEHKLLLTQVAGNLEAIISQRLVICRDGSRRPVVEIMRGGPVPSKFILEGRALELTEYIRSAGGGQQVFDQHVLDLYQKQLITYETALGAASNREQLQMAMRGIGKGDSNKH